MQIYANNFDEYLEQIPEDRRVAMTGLRRAVKENLPGGFDETFSDGFINYVVPLSVFPDGYHCTPGKALGFISLGSQKNSINLYHSGIYGSPDLLKWFQNEWKKVSSRKLDMGKSCIRLKPKEIPFGLIGELATKMTLKKWVSIYEKSRP